MSRRWLLSLSCLLLTLFFALRLSTASGEIKIVAAQTRATFQNQQITVLLPVTNSSCEIELKIVADDLRGKRGSREEFRLDTDEDVARLDTDKPIYQANEPVTLYLTSSIPNLNAVVDFARDSSILNSRTLRLHGGRALLAIPYDPEFKGKITIAAYQDFTDEQSLIATRTVLFPVDSELIGSDDQVAGLTVRDIERLSLARRMTSDLELVAEVLLNQDRNYCPVFFGVDSHERDLQKVFGDPIRLQVEQMKDALATRYSTTKEYPTNADSLKSILANAGIHFDNLTDPWGNKYRPEFTVVTDADVPRLQSRRAGSHRASAV